MNKPYTSIVIDDEPLARERLIKLLNNFSDYFQVIDTAKNGNEAKLIIEQQRPDVIFLDIEMPGLTGFELLEQLDVIPIVVFCTAYDQYALEAFETHSIDYLVKPVRVNRLQLTVEKLLKFQNKQTPSSKDLLNVIKELTNKEDQKKMTSITVKKGDKLNFIKLEDIAFLEAKDKYVNIITNKNIYMIEKSLSQLESRLPEYFLRVQRAYIVNTHYINEMQKYFNNRYIITLNNNAKDRITSGRSYANQIKNWMEI